MKLYLPTAVHTGALLGALGGIADNEHDKGCDEGFGCDSVATLIPKIACVEEAVKLLAAHAEGREADAGFDAGEFSGPAHDRMEDDGLAEIFKKHAVQPDRVNLDDVPYVRIDGGEFGALEYAASDVWWDSLDPDDTEEGPSREALWQYQNAINTLLSVGNPGDVGEPYVWPIDGDGNEVR